MKYNKAAKVGRTLWQMFSGKMKDWFYKIKHYCVGFNYEIDSPLPIKPTSYISIRTSDYMDHNFTVSKIIENTHNFDDKLVKSYDYDLVAKDLGKEDLHVKVRLIPNSKTKNSIKYQALALTLYYEQSYHEDFHQVLKDYTPGEPCKFMVTDDKDDENPDNDTEETFLRMGNLSKPYQISSIVVEDANGDKKITEDEVERKKMEYYDYYLETGKNEYEFLFVEMDKNTGWFQILRGKEIDPDRIMIL